MNAGGVKAILAGRKTQTRRVITPTDSSIQIVTRWVSPGHGDRWTGYHNATPAAKLRCPYGIPGNRLWVRETWTYITKAENENYTHRRPNNCPVEMLYRADALADGWADQCSWRPSIHMPRWASRITLEATGVRVERVQEISEANAWLDGAGMIPKREAGESYITQFHELWDSIYAKRGYGWDANPWVWVVEFNPIWGDTDAKATDDQPGRP